MGKYIFETGFMDARKAWISMLLAVEMILCLNCSVRFGNNEEEDFLSLGKE